jgi:hypothetical protein
LLQIEYAQEGTREHAQKRLVFGVIGAICVKLIISVLCMYNHDWEKFVSLVVKTCMKPMVFKGAEGYKNYESYGVRRAFALHQ